MIKFLHTADLHLDAPFAALSPEQAAARRQEQRELLTELAEAANTHDCDLVLLAGDYSCTYRYICYILSII